GPVARRIAGYGNRAPLGSAPWLHAEDAEAGRGDGRAGGGGQAEAEDEARVDRVDQAVVPQTHNTIIKTTLTLILNKNRIAQRRLHGSIQLGAARAQLVAAHRD